MKRFVHRFGQLLRRRAGHATEIKMRQTHEGALAKGDAPPQPRGFPAGHFYSPIPDLTEVHKDDERIFSMPDDGVIPGVDLNDDGQRALLCALAPLAVNLSFPEHETEGCRFHYVNPAYSWGDATMLHLMIRHVQPKRIVEIGSGYSSAMMLDTNDRWFDGQIACTFIEPYADLLRSRLAGNDLSAIKIIESRLQDVDNDPFDQLEAGDILFVDSTHVSKVDSDVNHVFFRILPRLREGVIIHFHDIFFPFEYPRSWVYEGRAWNENYVLRAFLQYNKAIEVLYFNHYMYVRNHDLVEQHLPVCLKNPGGAIWLRKTR
jgi:predicted O-methyltransferase YrrM